MITTVVCVDKSNIVANPFVKTESMQLRNLGWISVLLMLVYVLNAYVLFGFGG